MVNGTGLTYLFHSLDAVPVNLGGMLLQLGHQGGSIISSTFTLIIERSREDRKGIGRCTERELTCSAPTRFSGLLLMTAPVNLVMTTLPSALPVCLTYPTALSAKFLIYFFASTLLLTTSATCLIELTRSTT